MNKTTAAILVVGSIAILGACSRGEVAPASPTPTPEVEVEIAPAIETPTSGPGPAAAVRRDVSPHMLDQFLQVRKRMFKVYAKKGNAHVLARWLIDDKSIDPRSAGDAELNSILDQFNRERHLGMAEAGMHETHYQRAAEIVYGHWWRATAGGREIAKAIAFQEELIGLIDANLEWTRSPEAARILEEIPLETRQACESRAEELHRYEMLQLQPYADRFSITGLRPLSIARR